MLREIVIALPVPCVTARMAKANIEHEDADGGSHGMRPYWIWKLAIDLSGADPVLVSGITQR
jgi:hypothetical protein